MNIYMIQDTKSGLWYRYVCHTKWVPQEEATAWTNFEEANRYRDALETVSPERRPILVTLRDYNELRITVATNPSRNWVALYIRDKLLLDFSVTYGPVSYGSVDLTWTDLLETLGDDIHYMEMTNKRPPETISS